MNPWTYLPATGHELSSYERNCSLVRKRGMSRRLAQSTTWAVLRHYLRGIHGLDVRGSGHLPASGPFVLVANHSSHFDALVLGAALSPAHSRRFSLLAAGDTFFSSPTRAAFSSILLNAFPIWRKSCGGKALQTLRDRLEGRVGSAGSILALFPEGTRSRSGELARFKPGVGALVAGSRIPVVPACIWGSFEAWPPGQFRPGKGTITMRFGTPQYFDDQPDICSGWRAVAADLEARVREMHQNPPRQRWTRPAESTASHRPRTEHGVV